MTKPTTLLIATLLFLGGCSTQSTSNLNYYLLSNVDEASSGTVEIAKRKVTSLDVKMANYLHQANIAMQLENHLLYYSKQHLWAQPLLDAFQHSLQQDLNEIQTKYFFTESNLLAKQKANVGLIVQVDHFVATADSQVVLSGRYWFDSTEQDHTVHSFRFVLPLNQDGYAHSVDRLRQLISMLSRNIIDAQ